MIQYPPRQDQIRFTQKSQGCCNDCGIVSSAKKGEGYPAVFELRIELQGKHRIPPARRGMNPLTFVSSFGGVHLRTNHNGRQTSPTRRAMLRCAMGDSIAPKIYITDTKDESTNSMKIIWEPISLDTSTGTTLLGNVALAATLKSTSVPATAVPTAEKGPLPDGMSPADFYYPESLRNKAPVISFENDTKIAVSMDEINPVVGGIAANSVEKQSVAFWKAKTYKYSAADVPPPQPDSSEPISTAKFEKYFPSAVRNFAPAIEIKPPQGDWDTSAFIVVKNEYVGFNPSLRAGLDLSELGSQAEPPGSPVANEYFGKEPSYAPVVSISEEAETVEFGMEKIPLPEELADLLSRRMKTMYGEGVAAV